VPEPRVVKSERRYVGKIFNLLVDEIEYPSGRHSVREVAEHPGGAVAVPILPDGRIVLIRQFRYPMKKRLYELPAGKLNPGEDPELCAARELQEETGYVAGRLERLTSIYTTPGFCDELLHLYLASNLKKSPKGQALEEGERGLTVEIFPFEEVLKMIEDERIVDAKTICGILLADRRRTPAG